MGDVVVSVGGSGIMGVSSSNKGDIEVSGASSGIIGVSSSNNLLARVRVFASLLGLDPSEYTFLFDEVNRILQRSMLAHNNFTYLSLCGMM